MESLSHYINGAKNLVRASVKPETPLSQARIEICNRCPALGKHRRCTICGCFVDAKAKLPEQQCPENKW